MKTNPIPDNLKEAGATADPLDYNPEEDIYTRAKKISNINPDDNSIIMDIPEKNGVMNEKSFEEDMSGSDLDIPGAELDDRFEEIGEEDEENNYYSLGGDNHWNLDESS